MRPIPRLSAVLCLAMLAVVSSCRDETATVGLFEQERLFYKAQREAEKLRIDISGADSSSRIAVADLYLLVTNRYLLDRQNQTEIADTAGPAQYLAIRSLFSAAHFQVQAGARTEAITTLQRVKTEFPSANRSIEAASFEVARILEELSRWAEAYDIYHELMHVYRPESDTLSRRDLEWLSIPVGAYNHFNLMDADSIARDWLDTGITFFSGLIDENGISPSVNLLARGQLANMYELQERWDKAIETYESITDTLARQMPKAQLSKADLLWQKKGQYDRARAIYENVSRSDTTGRFAMEAKAKLAGMLIGRGQYEEARNILRESIQVTQNRGQIVFAPQLMLARSYEEEGRWDRALTEYRWLLENFPDAPGAYQTELHVINTLLKNNDAAMAREWYNTAVDRLDRVIEQNRTNETGARALLQKARVHVAYRSYQDAVEPYRELLDKFPPSLERIQGYLELSVIQAEHLDNPSAGAAVLEKLLRVYPNLPIQGRIEDRIAHLKSLAGLKSSS